jgi:hypothetical protein
MSHVAVNKQFLADGFSRVADFHELATFVARVKRRRGGVLIGAVIFAAKYIQGNVNITDVGIKWSVCIYAFIAVHTYLERDKGHGR